MIKSAEERKDISSTVDTWEYAIETELNKRWAQQDMLVFEFKYDDSLSRAVCDELAQRYKKAGWDISFRIRTQGITVSIQTLQEEQSDDN